MAKGFGNCIFKRVEKPSECEFKVSNTIQCAASGWELLDCYMKHYGSKLSPDAGVRLIETLCHLIMDNDDTELWDE